MPKYALADLPTSMRHLPRDPKHHSAPVPFFIDYVNGEPDFRTMDGRKLVRCIKEKLCWVCGRRLGVHVTFPLGCMCVINRTNAEPPSHYECARWSVQNCPFLSNPKMVRREDDLINNAKFNAESAGIGIARNPGVVALWRTRSYEVFPAPNGGVLFTVGEPEAVEWWTQSRAATREEVIESIESGLPILEAVARQETGALEVLERYKRRAWKWLPGETKVDPEEFGL